MAIVASSGAGAPPDAPAVLVRAFALGVMSDISAIVVRASYPSRYGERRVSRMAVIRLIAIAAFALLVSTAAGKPMGSPMGPWKHSTGSRTGTVQAGFGGGKPLVQQCQERWRETRLDHFR